MSILNVEHLSHGFGDRAIFQDVSFRLLKGEHIGLIGANGEGKSTFMNIITGHMQPDEGKVEWSKRVRVGYLDQHTVLEKGMTIREVLKSAFSFLFELEVQMNEICDHLGEASEDEMNVMMEELGTIQDLLMNHDFYSIDAKVEEVGRALGLTDIGLDRDVTDLSGGQRTKVLLGKLLLEKPDILLLDEPTNYLDVQHIEWLKRDLQEYIAGIRDGGDIMEDLQEIPMRERAGEYLMLRLRTSQGISAAEYEKLFLLPFAPLEDVLEKRRRYYQATQNDSGRWVLTPQGYLVSNDIITDLLIAQDSSHPLKRI